MKDIRSRVTEEKAEGEGQMQDTFDLVMLACEHFHTTLVPQ